MKYGLIGEKLGHSYSPEIHAKLADYTYQLCELAPDELPTFLQARTFESINVTIPYKTAVLPYLDELDDAAKEIGAVNTIKRVGQKLYGYNTDFLGLCALVDRIGVSLAGRVVLVLGSGGTSKTACAVAKSKGAAEVLVVGRQARAGVISYADAYERYAHASYIINTTPVGMFPSVDGTPIDVDRFPALAGVADAIYNPLRTDLVLAARAKGIPAEGGLYMLVAQAVYAAAIFTGKPFATETIETVYGEIRAAKENIFLVGMPGCGKSTVGARLAETLKVPFLDTDAEIVRRTGREIPAIFAEYGEEKFREIESAVVRDLANVSRGAVIATGGGAVLRAENVHAMRRSGRLYFLDRSLACICPTSDRPLSSDLAALQKRYAERYPIYCAVADVRVAVDENIAHTIETIGKDMGTL